jgi:predicted phage-related endonuclease
MAANSGGFVMQVQQLRLRVALANMRRMKRITHEFTTETAWLALRRQNINSTEIAALFGLSPRRTALELALTKAGKVDEKYVDNERTAWGKRLQSAISDGVSFDYGVAVMPLTDYVELEGLRIASSFDCSVYNTTIAAAPVGGVGIELNDLQRFAAERGAGILEIKNLDGRVFSQDLIMVDNQLEAAPHIELQLQHQMLVKGATWGAIAVLINGNDLRILIRPYDSEVGAMILDRCAKFWANLAAGKYPPADLPADAEVLKKLYNYGEPGSFYDGTGNELLAKACAEYNAASGKMKEYEDLKRVAYAEVLQIMQDHEKGVAAGWKISTWMVEPWSGHVEKDGYRAMRITKIKVKEAKK